MKKTLFTATAILLTALAAAVAAYFITNVGWVKTVAISLGVTTYHFVMRLAVGLGLDSVLHNRVDWNRRWFRPLKFEPRLHKFLRVKRWKKNMPTFESSYFDITKHTLPEVIGATCEAELVHETIFILSFLPIALIPIFGAFWVFVITSTVSALFDLSFVIIQRYNRPRLVRLLERGGK